MICMHYDGKILAKARAALDEERTRNQIEHQRRLSAVYAGIPEINDIDLTLRRQMSKLVRLTLTNDAQMQDKLQQLKNDNLALQSRRAELLKNAGYSKDYLDEIYSCPVCRDTGAVMGSVCECLKKYYNRELTRDLGVLMTGDESFEKFNLSLYPTVVDPVSNLIPRDTMANVYSVCRHFAETFSAASPNLLLQGSTGLGKTYLSACIAKTVAAKGFSVCYDTAVNALGCYETAHFSRDTDDGTAAAQRIKRMENCDLMILDDLGTEMITASSQSALYTLINNRLSNNRKTIISTNFTNADIQNKYFSQTVSRILGDFMRLPFVGNDIRRLR